jgi:16S rRNA (cytidine1402-2'-O)-methyltransferase
MNEKFVVESSLYIVATPIGNLGDITIRAIEILKAVDCILTENVRHSSLLLDHYGIKTKTRLYNDKNEHDIADAIVKEIINEKMTFAIISDAGTPLISDPGFKLVQQAAEVNIKVFSVPGPCASISALSVSGLPTNKFVFEGFLPPQKIGREQRLKLLEYETRTTIFYEAPHRIIEFLKSISRVFGSDRRIVIAREITKRFESIYRGRVSEIITFLDNNPDVVRGEFVVILSGAEEQFEYSDLDSLLEILLDELGLKQSVSLARKISKVNRNVIYERALKLSSD